MDLEFVGKLDLDALFACVVLKSALVPLQIAGMDPVLVLEDSALPDGSGHLVLRDTHFSTPEVFGFVDARIRVDENERVSEKPRREHGNRDVLRIPAVERDHVRGHRHLGDLEVSVPELPPERLFRFHTDEVQIDSIRLNVSVVQGDRSVADVATYR
jgi:hypothetical protein